MDKLKSSQIVSKSYAKALRTAAIVKVVIEDNITFRFKDGTEIVELDGFKV